MSRGRVSTDKRGRGALLLASTVVLGACRGDATPEGGGGSAESGLVGSPEASSVEGGEAGDDSGLPVDASADSTVVVEAGADDSGPGKDAPAPLATSVLAGDSFSCATLRDGTGVCWGEGSHGELGAGPDVRACHDALPDGGLVSDGSCDLLPSPITGLTSAVSMAVFGSPGSWACALRSQGDVACWGSNPGGALGNGAITSNVPVSVAGITDATAVSVGGDFACALRAQGAVACWGNNGYGQLGHPSTDTCSSGSTSTPCSKAPDLVTGLTGVTAVAAGADFACAVYSNGDVACWGNNAFGQLGVGGTQNQSAPVGVLSLQGALQGSPASAIAAGDAFACAIVKGAVKCWGDNREGQLGSASAIPACASGTPSCSTTPVTVSGVSNAIAVAAGGTFACALLSDHTVWCWGSYLTTVAAAAAPVPGLTGVAAISAGSTHACALLNSGDVECWYDNRWGQLGDGTTQDSPAPVHVNL